MSLSGPAVDIYQELAHAPVARRAKVDTKASKKASLQRLVIGIGQMHPVLSGRFSYFTARKIGLIQGWIFHILRWFHDHHDVQSFGQEGYASSQGGVVHSRMHPALINELKAAVDGDDEVSDFLLGIAQRWRKALKRGDRAEVALTNSALDGLALLQALDPHVTMFPIEQLDVHGRIGAAMSGLQQAIAQLEATSAFQGYQAKGGRNLTKSEYAAAKQRNALVKEFNQILSHPDRERSILREVLEHAEGQPVTVFILGQAHRKPFLRLAKKHLPDDVLFLWITPPHLWWKRAWLQRLSWLFVGLLVLLMALYVVYG